jgi:hypothetical protein
MGGDSVAQLTKLQARWAIEYAIDRNATQAAIKAGYMGGEGMSEQTITTADHRQLLVYVREIGSFLTPSELARIYVILMEAAERRVEEE